MSKPKGKPACLRLCSNAAYTNSTQAFTRSRGPDEKRRQLLTAGAPSFTHSPGSCLGMGREVREEPVKVPEIGKRSACYHSLRKGSETCGLANLTRGAHIKKR